MINAYIPEFVCGAVSVILAELAIVIIVSITQDRKVKRDIEQVYRKENNEE